MSRLRRFIAGIAMASLVAVSVWYAMPAAAADIGSLAGAGPRPGATRLAFTAGDSVTAQVDVGSGNLMVTVRGLELRGVLSNTPLDAWYNSAAVEDGPSTRMGAGWGLDFTSDVQLEENPDSSVTYHGPGGLTWMFPRQPRRPTTPLRAPRRH